MLAARWIQHAALCCAIGAVVFSFLAIAISIARSRHPLVPHYGVPHFFFVVALLLGVAAAIVLAVTLCMRAVYISIDLGHGYPWRVIIEYGYGREGLVALSFLWLAALAGWIGSRDQRLITCLVWNSIALALWGSLMIDPFRVTSVGGIEHSQTTVLCMTALAIILAASVFAWTRVHKPSANIDPPLPAPMRVDDKSGFRHTITALAGVMTIMICYHLLVPVTLGVGGVRGSIFIAVCAAALSSRASFLAASLGRGEDLLDCAMMLASLAVSGIVLLVTMPSKGPLSERYPVFLTSFVIGFALACAVWSRLTALWSNVKCDHTINAKTAALKFHAQRAAFLCAVMGLLSATLLCFWPRIRGISAMDHSLNQVRSGIAANLLLLLVVLSSARRFRRWSFHILCALCLGSGVGFVFVRTLPFKSHMG
ncbi:MAG: hypothetical protein HY287_17215 [Planctomycetes bacterium]|nr:hypothetical protein [Planctomycetota bacterium]MBI3836067.1 hypothetical protein [Planctomycetota bacterium]